MNLPELAKPGVLVGFHKRLLAGLARRAGLDIWYYHWKFPGAVRYRNPSDVELRETERRLEGLCIPIQSYHVDKDSFGRFKRELTFPGEYHGGENSGIWTEKLLEHYLAFDLLNLRGFSGQDIYIDIAGGSSPWAAMLRERLGLNAFAVDLEVGPGFQHFSHYRQCDAKSIGFPDGSVRGLSLQCAYEMFTGNDDIEFLQEAHRILVPGGKLIISPLYLHTHYCAYSTPDFWGKGFSDPDVKEYLRLDCRGVPSSRKYSPEVLCERVLRRVSDMGMGFRLFALRNKDEVSPEIYCHFILEVTR